MKPINNEVFRTYDIRGLVDKDFDEEWVEVLGKACGTYFKKNGYDKAVIGHDCRHTSPGYQAALASGITSTGVDVITLGLVPTPVFYYAAKVLGLGGGAIVTASHNPPEFNGFKVWLGETTAHSEQIQDVFKIMESGDFADGNGSPGSVEELDILPRYLDELAAQVKLTKPIKVVVDGGNGTGGEVTAELLRRVGAEVVCQFCEPDGDFPNHHPDPVVEKYMTQLQDRVLAEGAVAGIGLDGDNDRIGVVNEKGKLMFGDQLLAIYARKVLKQHPGTTVIGEVKCSHLLYKDIETHGGEPLMWKTGHSLIKAKMKEVDSKLAGEMSGHMFFADRYYGFDDATYAAMRLVEILDGTDTPLSEMLADWPTTYNTPEIRFDCPEAVKAKVVAKAQEFFAAKYDVSLVDGVRILFPDGWALVRSSNTQPVLVLRFEAESPERLEEIRALVEKPLNEWVAEFGG
ncbi:MAG: phosphomannomutase/phosphoglucomutase [Okeania sp. SIO3B3]|nr:phosphomannomutase/phosphoglucomutase [Okeania sp. SIO3B3]